MNLISTQAILVLPMLEQFTLFNNILRMIRIIKKLLGAYTLILF